MYGEIYCTPGSPPGIVIPLSSLCAFFKMSDNEGTYGRYAVFVVVPKYGFLFYVWVCSATEPVRFTSLLYTESLVTFIRKVKK